MTPGQIEEIELLTLQLVESYRKQAAASEIFGRRLLVFTARLAELLPVDVDVDIDRAADDDRR